MAPLGVIFFASTSGFFRSLAQFPTVKKGLHYVMSGITAAFNAAYTTSGIVKIGLAIGIGLVGGPVGWVIAGCMLASAVIGLTLGVLERKQKYAENSKLKQVVAEKKQTKRCLRARVQENKISLMQNLLPTEKRYLENVIRQWQEQRQWFKANDITLTGVEQGVAPTNTRTGLARAGFWLGNAGIRVLEYSVLLPFSDRKVQADKLRATWEQKYTDMTFGKQVKSSLDWASERFSELKNYSRSIKLIASLLPSLALIVLGIHTLNPVLIVVGVATAITYGTMNHYQNKWEDDVFAENGDLHKKIVKTDLEIALLQEEELLLNQLQKVKSGEAIDFSERTRAEQVSFMRQFRNPLRKVKKPTIIMLGISTSTGCETVIYAGIAIAAAVIGLKLALVTGGLSAVVGLSIAVGFGILAIGNLLRRGYKETKQLHKEKQLEDEHNGLKVALRKYSHLKPAVELDKIEIHNYRSSLGSSNYIAYKAASGLKKTEKSYGLIAQMAQHGHPLLIGIGIGVVTLNPVFLAVGIIVGGILAYGSYKAEQTRLKRDKALEDLSRVNACMKIELKRLQAAEQRMQLVKQAQQEFSKDSTITSCQEHVKNHLTKANPFTQQPKHLVFEPPLLDGEVMDNLYEDVPGSVAHITLKPILINESKGNNGEPIKAKSLNLRTEASTVNNGYSFWRQTLDNTEHRNRSIEFKSASEVSDRHPSRFFQAGKTQPPGLANRAAQDYRRPSV
jgi:hypothetical protein